MAIQLETPSGSGLPGYPLKIGSGGVVLVCMAIQLQSGSGGVALVYVTTQLRVGSGGVSLA